MEAFDDARHAERLLAKQTRRLQLLEEQWALDGPRTNPAVIIEIEEIRPLVKRMRASLMRPPAPAALYDLSEQVAPLQCMVFGAGGDSVPLLVRFAPKDEP